MPLVTRDAERRLLRFRQIRFATGFDLKKECESLARAVEDGELVSAGKSIRQSILAWCCRVLATVDYPAAQATYEKAREFGESTETTVAEAFLKAFATPSDKPAALAMLAALGTPLAYTAALMIQAHNDDPAFPLKWLSDTGLTTEALDSEGKLRVIGLKIAAGAWVDALEVVESLTDRDVEETPSLLMTSATVYLAHAVHEDMREAVLIPLPEPLDSFPLSEDADAMTYRAKALSLFRRAAARFEDLEIGRIAALTRDQALWLALRNPASKAEALKELETSMSNPKTRLRRFPMALAFGLQLDLQVVKREIDSEVSLTGGKSSEAAIARFALAVKRRAPEVADYIERHRAHLREYYTADFLDAIAVEALSKANRIDDAQAKLAELIARGIPENVSKSLKTIVDEAAGADPIAAREAEYAAQPVVPNLMILVEYLRGSQNAGKLEKYAGKLFEALRDTPTAEIYTSALYQNHADDKIVELAESYPDLIQGSDILSTNVSWALYRLGKIQRAKAMVDELRVRRDIQNDRYLYMNIAIASGDWSTLNAFVESEWANRDRREPVELLRAGMIAQRVGSSPRSQELIRTAASKANGDPHILVHCYSAATSAGWENEENIHKWLTTAVNASGEEGPVKAVKLEELLDQQPGWNEHVDRIWQMLVQGEVPMFLASKVANRTLLDFTLRPALQNIEQTDVRQRGIIFAFSGTRLVGRFAGKRIALDVTTLLNLTLSGRLTEVLQWCDSVVISHTTLGWLFQERHRLAFHQPSQVRRAQEVKKLIDTGQLHKFESTAPPAEIEQEVGDEIARYLVAAKTLDATDPTQKIVIRPYPLPKAGSLLKDEANVSGFENYLAGCKDVIDTMKVQGGLTASEVASAAEYLQLHEKLWPHNPQVRAGATLYLDELAVSFFQHLGLLGKLSKAGFRVFVPASEIERADELVGFESVAGDATHIVEELQTTLREGIASGKIELGRLRKSHEDEDNETDFEIHPTRLLFAAPLEVDAIVVDDRCFNRHGMIGKTPIATSIDLLSTMVADGIEKQHGLIQTLTKLRAAGLALVPHLPGEILKLLNDSPVVEGSVRETAELRTVRQSITRVRMSDILQLPSEAAWLDHLTRELLEALRTQWSDDISDADARGRSDWIVRLLDARGWSHRSSATGVDAVERYRAQVTMLSMHTTAAPEARERYWRWFEGAILEEFRQEQPGAYQRLVEDIANMIDSTVQRPHLGGPDE